MMTRRAFIAALSATVAVASDGVTARAGFHITGTLTSSEAERTEGYFVLCTQNGVCHPTDAFLLGAHPQSPVYDDLVNLIGKQVHVSVTES